MDALNLAIEDGVGVNDLPGRRFEPIGKLRLCRFLRFEEHFTEAVIWGKWFEFLELAQVSNPTLADHLCNCTCHRGIGLQQPAPWGYPIGFVVKTLGKHFGEILDRRSPQQLR